MTDIRPPFRPTGPDEVLVVNGATVTARQLAEARQQLAHEGSHLDLWDELSPHDRPGLGGSRLSQFAQYHVEAVGVIA